MTGFVILIALALIVLFWGVGAYKRLVRLQNQVKSAFSRIDAEFKRRHDLVPSLVETAKACMKHERDALEAVIGACNQAVGANARAAADPADPAALRGMAAAEDALSSVLGRMLALCGSSPELKANRNMMQLSEELAVTESRIAFARQAYNEGVLQYNTSREQFPSTIIAGMFAFKPSEPLQSAGKIPEA